MSTPIDQFLQEKRAFGREFASNVGHSLAQGAGSAIAAGVVAGVGVAASKIYDAVTKQRDFKSMLSSPYNQDLHEHYQARPKEFNAAFSSLRSVNPEFTKDPMVAGTYLRRMMTFDPKDAGGTLIEALQHRDRFPNPIGEAMQQAGTAGAGKGFEAGARQRDDLQRHQNMLAVEEAKARMGLSNSMTVENHKDMLGQQREARMEARKAQGGQSSGQGGGFLGGMFGGRP